jgi:tRNA threonylcarbamoyladenosine biosynthesis protein TsaE
VQLAHVDLYRIENNAELSDLGLDELADQGAVVVEWGGRIDVPDAALIDIENLGDDRRVVRTKRDLSH